ncbi:SH3 domain-containing kinase-binding protein 1 [Anabarilius grahami]|uniref:Osteoclast-stimulating factor 1 n=1 Tax=Anabarilius grahami TaxID=495550 RepID=A0A3N0Y8Z0_ANAGA|nr:SH3 domain-containing kinase-binding protein 1 [Anabarilius grahami]
MCEAIRKKRCKAAFSYTPQNGDELELKIGDVIEVLGEVEEGWWEGTLNGKTGMFPSNFTKELLAEAEDLTPQDDTRSTRTSIKDSTGSESDGGDSSSLRSDTGSVSSSSEIQPKKVRGFGFGDIFKDQPIKLRPRSMDMDNEAEKPQMVKKVAPAVAQETMKAEPDNKAKAKEFCKVIFPYEAQNEDELSIKEGDIVTIVNKECADAGWWLGELNGKQGVFPDNFVKLFIPEVEKERPKKPPPPAAPTTKQVTDKKTEAKKVPPERPESLPHRSEEKGEDSKLSDIPKPSLPAFLPKKPLPPKNNNALNRPSSLPPKRPDRPERPAVPNIPCDSPKSDSSGVAAERGSADKSLDIDVEDFDSIVLSTEKLNHPTASRPRVMDRRPRSQVFTSGPEKSSLPPKPSAPLSSSGSGGASLHQGAAGLRPHSPSVDARGKNEQGAATLEELKAQLRDLKGTVELMKSQHKQEIKQLVSELDEEKRIRISLQSSVSRRRPDADSTCQIGRKKADEDQLQPTVWNTLRKLSRPTKKNCPTADRRLGVFLPLDVINRN